MFTFLMNLFRIGDRNNDFEDDLERSRIKGYPHRKNEIGKKKLTLVPKYNEAVCRSKLKIVAKKEY